MFRRLLPAIVLQTALMGFATTTTFAQADKAAEEITKRGGRLDRDEKGDKPIVTVNYGVSGIDDSGLDSLTGLKSLKKLTLNNTKITDGGLAKIKSLSTIEKLYLVDTKITDAAIDHLKELKNLQVLSLAGTGVTDASLEKLKAMPKLNQLFVYGTKVSDEGVKKLKAAMPKLKTDKDIPPVKEVTQPAKKDEMKKGEAKK